MGEEPLLSRIGGPGYLRVMPGSIALLEGLDGHIRVVGPGKYYVTEMEIIKETFSLGEMNGMIEKTSAVTRDGIEITAREIAYRYRLYAGEASPGSTGTFSNEAEGMVRMVYNRAMGAESIGDWHGAIKGTVEGFIQDFIRKNICDYLTAPTPQVEDPRGDIQQQFYSPAGKSRFHDKGAELIWVDVGHFDAPGEVAEQTVGMWQAGWSGTAELLRATGEAERTKAQEMGRNEGQAKLIESIVDVLTKASTTGDDRKFRMTVLLASISRLMEGSTGAMLSLPPETQKDTQKDEPK
jgi:hypothetical protein